MDRTERILKYLDGKLSPEELDQFKEEFKKDPALLDELIIHQEVDAVIQKMDEKRFRKKLKEAYNAYLEEENVELISKKKKKILSLKKAILPVFLVIIILIATILLIPGKDNSELFAKYYSTFTQDINVRSFLNQEGNLLMAEGISFYYTGNYDNACEKFKLYLAYDSTSIPAIFYCGLSLLETDKPADAIEYFKKVLKDNNNFYKEHAAWYLALSYIRINKPDYSLYLLEDLRSHKTTYTDAAGNLLRDIESQKSKIRLI